MKIRHCPATLTYSPVKLRFDGEAIRIGVAGILRVMNCLGMYSSPVSPATVASVQVSQTHWVRASRGGIFHLEVKLGEWVEKKQRLGLITDAFGEEHLKIRSPLKAMVIGHSQNPLINQGDGLIHLAAID